MTKSKTKLPQNTNIPAAKAEKAEFLFSPFAREEIPVVAPITFQENGRIK